MEQWYDLSSNSYRSVTETTIICGPPVACTHSPECAACWVKLHPAEVVRDPGTGL